MPTGQLVGGGEEGPDQFPWQCRLATVRGAHHNLDLLWHHAGSRGEGILMRGVRFDLLRAGEDARTGHGLLRSPPWTKNHLQ